MNQQSKKSPDRQFAAEARIVMIVVSVCAAVFCFTAYKRISGAWDDTPDDVLAVVDQKRALAASADQLEPNANVDIADIENASKENSNAETPPRKLLKQDTVSRTASSDRPIQPRSFMVVPGASSKNVKTSFDSPIRTSANGGGFKPNLPVPKSFDPQKPFEVPAKTATIETRANSKPDPEPANPFRREPSANFETEDGGLRAIKAAESDQETPTVRTTISRQGDTFWIIAQRVYDDGQLFRALYEANKTRVKDFENIVAGTELVIPDESDLRKQYADLRPKQAADSDRKGQQSSDDNFSQRPQSDQTNSKGGEDKKEYIVYSTKTGDTLFDIARWQLGQASRYNEILKLNKDQLPTNVASDSILKSGLQLKIPK